MTDPTAAAAWECVVTSRDGDVIQCDAYAMDGSKDVEFWTIEVPGNQWAEGHAFYVVSNHAADDAEPIAGWIDSEFVYPEGMDDWKRNIVERWIDKMPNATRGQLRLLLRALSQEPQP